MAETIHISGADAPFDIVWDQIGVAHVYADTVADAYRGMGFAAASERLWQIHLSCAYANGEAAALLGERFVAQDALQRACNVHGGQTPLPASEGDWIASAYLEGMNAFIDQLDEPPPEFLHAGAAPRHFTMADIAARYRFTSWFQHKTWTEKLVIGRLMATHGADYFRNHLLHFSQTDEDLISRLGEPLRNLPTEALPIVYPDFYHKSISGSNNWAVTGALSRSGKPILATDPHQPHSIPNTFFYVHLHAGDWDAFGAAFPGVPYFMMGFTRDIAWGLTTGCVDCYDLYVEQLRDGDYRTPGGWQPIEHHTEQIAVKGGGHRDITTAHTRHGLLLESLTDALGLSEHGQRAYATALHWSLAQVPTSAGALAQLPLATTAQEFGEKLFEHDVCPLVNNIVCVDRHDGLRRFIATTMPARSAATGSVPLPGWEAEFDFRLSSAAELTVETDPAAGFSLTANNDTMGEDGPFNIHNFPAHSARADRIRQLLTRHEGQFCVDDFKRMQLDLLDLRALQLLPDIIATVRTADDDNLQRAADLLGGLGRPSQHRLGCGVPVLSVSRPGLAPALHA